MKHNIVDSIADLVGPSPNCDTPHLPARTVFALTLPRRRLPPRPRCTPLSEPARSLAGKISRTPSTRSAASSSALCAISPREAVGAGRDDARAHFHSSTAAGSLKSASGNSRSSRRLRGTREENKRRTH
ncbi:hypothetical protein FA95DRAFT_1555845 [Auriscalpium vulgare]|uniref:Uncharacterized protein n=1 Tax=Auriscalpium vulgare TaxID=40419 RepID=A0ACB8S2H0_9AGAM|nr:hypothetical protein FA95DRAFT_1555845 [Auriscalpium vulgare]